ncbi:hypothetical protein [Paenibacillus sp. Soil787]|uniref:hypothetical protein n=1 Tax=Paenibacillus sp. Soil787 TaxID=1736411 RepID=UPI0006FFDE74|nr:hypothetical protein [Paenibacillus sp. Soil787]KRF37975.1 hypothetical protein ASG93_24825 [Paenibacillus sp. Soil787]
MQWKLSDNGLEHAVKAFEITTTKSKQQASLRFSNLLSASGRNGEQEIVPVDEITSTSEGLQASGESESFEVRSSWKQMTDICDYFEVSMDVEYKGKQASAYNLQFGCSLEGTGKPDWMIPGAFYKENRFEKNLRPYPRYDFKGGDPQQMVSDYWSFRADRAALPAVFAWNDGMCGALCTDEMSPLGLSGLGFRGNEAGTEIWLNFPYKEEPVTFIGNAVPAPADLHMHTFLPGEKVVLHFYVYAGTSDAHSYNPFVRQMYAIHRQAHGLNPWMGLEQAAELTAHGLYEWHYDKENDILRETAAFDREFNNNVKGMGDRPHMHVSWVSGVPYAYALLTYGRKKEASSYMEAGIRVLDKIATGLAPCGTFWASWELGRGWTAGWNPKKTWLQARTVSEATLFLVRALAFEREAGVMHPEWEHAVLSNLRFAAEHQRSDGNFGSYYDCETGEVQEWDGAGGMLWIAALLEGASYFEDEGFAASAVRGGSYYERFIRDEYMYGAPEDVHLTPTSEDAYNAVVSYVLLYEFNNQPLWLELASSAADWMMTFRWTYNLQFPKHSLLAQYDYCSRGADQASTSNQHLHNYGLFAVPEMLRLWTYTGDRYYLDRTRDHISCFLQFIAREDGDFNAYKGMVTERFYNTNCFQPKGMMLTLSHSWCIGLILYAAQASLPYENELDLYER